METIISIYAAIIATIALIWNIIDSRKKEKPNFLINCAYKIIRSEENEVYYLTNFNVRVINIKDVPRKVKLHSLEYIQDDIKSKKIMTYDIPNKNFEFSEVLNNSEEYTFNVKDEFLKLFRPENNSKFRVVIVDNSDNYYNSKFYSMLRPSDVKCKVLSVEREMK